MDSTFGIKLLELGINFGRFLVLGILEWVEVGECGLGGINNLSCGYVDMSLLIWELVDMGRCGYAWLEELSRLILGIVPA